MVRLNLRSRLLTSLIVTISLLSSAESKAEETAAYLAQVELDGYRVAITEARLLNFASLHPERPLAELLNDLIEFELLAIKRAVCTAEERLSPTPKTRRWLRVISKVNLVLMDV